MTVDLALAPVAAVSLTVAALLTPIAGLVARRTGILSRSSSDRWSDRRVPLLGGAVVLVAIVVPVLFAVPTTKPLLIVVAGTAAAFVLGLIDDIRPLPPTTKLVGQVAIASGLAIGGISVQIISFPPLAFLLTLFWIVGLMNAVNLVDNMDGLAAGLTAIAAGVLVLMAGGDHPWVAALAAATAGACAGFLFHNFAPARIYLGDAGSLALGCLLASLALILTNAAASNVGLAVLGPLLVLGLPIFDTAFVTISRGSAGRPIGRGGRDHTSHRLAALGLGERGTVLVLYAIAAAMAVLGLLSNALGFALLPLTALVVVALALFGVFLTSGPGATKAPQRSRIIGATSTLARFGGEVALDATLATVALFSAYLVRFEGIPPAAWMYLFVGAAPIVVPIQLAAFVVLGVYRALWRYVDVGDLMVIARSAAVGSVVAGVIVLYPFGLPGQSRGVLLIDAVLLVLLTVGSRVFLAWLREWSLRSGERDRRVVIVGAAETGELALRALLRTREYRPVAFVDDDPGKQRRRLAGIPVLGTIADLPGVLRSTEADLVVLALDAHDIERAHDVRRQCVDVGAEVREFVRAF